MKRIILFTFACFYSTLVAYPSKKEVAAICLQTLNQAAHGMDKFIDEPADPTWCMPVTSNCFAGAVGGTIAKILCPQVALPCCIATQTLATLGWIRSCSKLKDNKPAHRTLLHRQPTNEERIPAGLCGCALAFQPQACFIAIGIEYAVFLSAADYVSGKQRFMRPGG
jgi:hypothetical protein